MRSVVPAFALAVLLLSGSVGHTAPICVDRHGEMRRCEATHAMPVGWSLPADEQRDRLAARSDEPGARQLLGLTAFLAGLFALFALVQDFEGRWDRQEGDEEERD